MGNAHQITISADANGNFTYSPSTLNARIGDTVSWSSEKGPFGISFMDQTPFQKVSYSSKENEQKQHHIDPVQIKQNTIGHHHYAVAVAIAGPPGPLERPTTQIMLDSGCPDIVVSGSDN
jgi:plastocyanin